MSFDEWYKRSQEQAKLYNVSFAELDWLIIGTTEINRLQLKLGNIELNLSQTLELDRLWHQRIEAKIPIQYLMGKTYWRDLELYVTSAVLIPRPETEIMVDIALAMNDRNSESIWVDLGTGSGAIAIGLALGLKNSQIYAVDYSSEALKIAAKNAEKYGLSGNTHSEENRIQFYQGSWFEPISHLKSQITGMISNPPYIPRSEIFNLEPEVRHEPYLALDGGEDGLDCIRYLIQTAPEYLMDGGCWLIEIMAGQAKIVRSLLKANGNYTNIQTHLDYDRIERFVSANLK
jgi:release factor glutamine methyltransferase